MLTTGQPQFNRCFTNDHRLHVTSVLTAAVVGFLSGCILHGVFAHKPVFFTDAIALLVTSITAAILTSVWVLRTPQNTPRKDLQPCPPHGSGVWEQRRLVEERDTPTNLKPDPPLNLPGLMVTAQNSDSLARKISETLGSNLRDLKTRGQKLPWLLNVSRVALRMWTDGEIKVKVCSSTQFMESGLRDLRSFSTSENDTLSVTTSGVSEGHLGFPEWESIMSNL